MCIYIYIYVNIYVYDTITYILYGVCKHLVSYYCIKLYYYCQFPGDAKDPREFEM